MNTFMTIMSLILLTVMSYLAGHLLSLLILTLSRWSARFNDEERFPWQRVRRINRTIASVVGLMVAVVVMYFSAPATIQSLRSAPPEEAPPQVEIPQETEQMP